MSGRVVAFDMTDHLAEARRMVEAARQEGRRIVAEAHQQSHQIKERAAQEGYQQGHEKGLAEGRAAGHQQGLTEATDRFQCEQASLIDSVTSVIEAFEKQKRELLILANHDLLRLAVTLAEKIVHRLGRIDRQVAVANVEQVLRLIATRTDLAIRVHPLDAETLRRFAGSLSERADTWQHVTVIEDDSLAPGGAVVVASGGMEVDARLETQLEQITRLLLGEDRNDREYDGDPAEALPDRPAEGPLASSEADES